MPLCFLPWLSILHSKTVLSASILIAASTAEVGEDSKALMLSTCRQFKVRKVGNPWTTHLVHCEPSRRPQMLLSSFLRPAPPGWWGEGWFVSSLSVSYRHDFLLAGLTFPSLAASVPFYD